MALKAAVDLLDGRVVEGPYSPLSFQIHLISAVFSQTHGTVAALSCATSSTRA